MVFFGACEGLPGYYSSDLVDRRMFIWCTGLTSIGGSCRLPSITSWTCSRHANWDVNWHTYPKLTQKRFPCWDCCIPMIKCPSYIIGFLIFHPVNTNLPVVSPGFHQPYQVIDMFQPPIRSDRRLPCGKPLQLLCLEILLHHCWAPMYGWYTKGFRWQTPTSAIWLVLSTHPRNVITILPIVAMNPTQTCPKFGKVISSTEFQPYDFLLVAFCWTWVCLKIWYIPNEIAI